MVFIVLLMLSVHHTHELYQTNKLKLKARDSYIACLTWKSDQPHFTIIEVAVDRQEPMVLQC